MTEAYETHQKGIRIVPGQWRPHYSWEHIAWISPSWPSQDYVWLDFPEAVWSSQGLIFLSHINPAVPFVYESLPALGWHVEETGIRFERVLPNGVVVGGRVIRDSNSSVALSLYLQNGSQNVLANIRLQTCLFLRGCREFAEFTMDNKFVHTPDKGWQPFLEALHAPETGQYRLGWLSGPAVADRPLMAARSSEAERWVVMTWHDTTFSLIANPRHPCLHADPFFPDLAVGERAEIHGHIYFHEGPLDAFPVQG